MGGEVFLPAVVGVSVRGPFDATVGFEAGEGLVLVGLLERSLVGADADVGGIVAEEPAFVLDGVAVDVSPIPFGVEGLDDVKAVVSVVPAEVAAR